MENNIFGNDNNENDDNESHSFDNLNNDDNSNLETNGMNGQHNFNDNGMDKGVDYADNSITHKDGTENIQNKNVFFNNHSQDVNQYTYLNDRGNMEEKYKFDFNRYENSSYHNDMSNIVTMDDKKVKNSYKKVIIVIVVAVLLFTSLFIFYDTVMKDKKPYGNDNTVNNNGLVIKDAPKNNKETSVNGTLDGTAIAEKAKPSIVGVVTYSSTNTIEPSGIGSGIIMSRDGYIITNAHVIDKSSGIKIVLSNGKEYEATMIGIDIKTDLALVKIDVDDLTPAEFGDSNKLKDGEDVMAIGNPSGLELSGSITKGIVSGVNRKITSYGGLLINAIQTDAAINPGNSGGALVNSYGQVIGINTAKIAQQNVEGIGFAIPINDAKPIIDNLMEFGYVKDRVRLGITFVILDEISSKMSNLPIGAYIKAIDERSDMYKKGVRPGDVLLEFNGVPINRDSDLANALLKYKPGQKVRIKIYRKETPIQGKNMDLTITLQEDSPKIFGAN